VGNFDEDDDLEIVAVSTASTTEAFLTILDSDIPGGTSGQPLTGWPQLLPGNSEASPVVGDIDGDGVQDIVFGIGGSDVDVPNNLYAFKGNGEFVAGFPITHGGPVRSSAVIWDLDRDSDVDIVYCGWDRLVHARDMPFAFSQSEVPWPTFRGHMMRDGVHRPAEMVDLPDQLESDELVLVKPFPNPFNPSTSVKLYLPGPAGSTVPLQVRVFNLQGRQVRSLHEGSAAVGWHTWIWDGRDTGGRAQASGVYFLRVRSLDRTVVRKIALVK
jgi:hypothetical protein